VHIELTRQNESAQQASAVLNTKPFGQRSCRKPKSGAGNCAFLFTKAPGEDSTAQGSASDDSLMDLATRHTKIVFA
jgi:hypothetical protein